MTPPPVEPPAEEIPAHAPPPDPAAGRPHLRPLQGGKAAGERSQPRSLKAEESIAGAVLAYGKSALERISDLRTEHLFDPACLAILDAARALHRESKPTDPLAVEEYMRQAETIGKLKARGGPSYLAELANRMPTLEALDYCASLVRRTAAARAVIERARQLQERAYRNEDPDQLLKEAGQLVDLLQEAQPRARVKLFDEKAFLDDALTALSLPIPPKLPFGIQALDEAMDGGVPAGGVVILAAPPKHLKTGLLISLLARWARQGQRIVYATGENTRKEIYSRLSSHEQFGLSNKFHTRIKHEPEQAESNVQPIQWMAGRVRIVSLPDEEIKEPRGLTWPELLKECDAEQDPPLLIVDYVEEFADRLARGDQTDQQLNKAVMRMLKNYACRRQARVLAVCSVSRGQYSGLEGVFKKPDAKAEDFGAVAKHSGYIDYAASALLALQFSDGGKITDPDSGHPCVPMRLHLAFTREGPGPVTVPMLSFGGYCRFVEDTRDPEEIAEGGDDAGEEMPGLEGKILRELAKDEHAGGQTGPVIAKLVEARMIRVKAVLRDLVRSGELVSFTRGRAIVFRHPKHTPPGFDFENPGPHEIN